MMEFFNVGEIVSKDGKKIDNRTNGSKHKQKEVQVNKRKDKAVKAIRGMLDNSI